MSLPSPPVAPVRGGQGDHEPGQRPQQSLTRWQIPCTCWIPARSRCRPATGDGADSVHPLPPRSEAGNLAPAPAISPSSCRPGCCSRGRSTPASPLSISSVYGYRPTWRPQPHRAGQRCLYHSPPRQRSVAATGEPRPAGCLTRSWLLQAKEAGRHPLESPLSGAFAAR